jgi:enhancing lycopene biosynthesis protein 2
MKKVGVILSGCGVYDGSEIQEAVFSLLEISLNGGTYQCYAPDINQHHVINHRSGEEMKETRNVLTEAARIARGDIKPLSEFNSEELDAIVIPGGFGAAKNLTKWAFSGPDGEILPELKNAIVSCVKAGKPVVGLCMGPTVIAKALEDTDVRARMTVGTTKEKSPYDIAAISAGMEKTGAVAEMRSIDEISIDKNYKIITAPCYMMEGSVADVYKNVKQAIEALFNII